MFLTKYLKYRISYLNTCGSSFTSLGCSECVLTRNLSELVCIKLCSLKLFSLGSHCLIKVNYKATDSFPKDGYATWPLATPSLELLLITSQQVCVWLLSGVSHLTSCFYSMNFIIIPSSLCRFPPVWMCFPGCYLSVTLMYWLMPAGPSHIYLMDLMIKFKQSLMQGCVEDLWSCWCKLSWRKCICFFLSQYCWTQIFIILAYCGLGFCLL